MLIKDRFPAYITWEQYLKNRERIKQNQNAPDTSGIPRTGPRAWEAFWCAVADGICSHPMAARHTMRVIVMPLK